LDYSRVNEKKTLATSTTRETLHFLTCDTDHEIAVTLVEKSNGSQTGISYVQLMTTPFAATTNNEQCDKHAKARFKKPPNDHAIPEERPQRHTVEQKPTRCIISI
jgi:hypothetical protein